MVLSLSRIYKHTYTFPYTPTQAAGSAERIFDLMETDRKALTGGVGGSSRSGETTSAGASSASAVSGPLIFKGISFAYPTRPDSPVFKVKKRTTRRVEQVHM